MPAPALNGYALADHFRKLRARYCFTPLEADVFYELVGLCNDEHWPEVFYASNGVITGALGCSEQGLINARKRLEEAGLLAYVSGNRRTPTQYRFVPQGSTEFSHSSADGSTQGSTQFRETPADGSTEFSHSAPETADGSTQGSTEFSPYKEQRKRKKKVCAKAQNEGAQNEAQQPLPFEQFWDAYQKKTGRLKASQKWAALTAAEQAAILAHLPGYVAATPEKQYRKDAATYLHNRTWEDEELPPPRGGQRLAPDPGPAPAAPLPAPELNQDFIDQQLAEQATRFRAHLARHAAAALP